MKTPSQQSVEQVPIDTLTPHANNARTHSKKQIKQIATSIATHGFLNPILIDAHNRIIAGHGRVEAARLHGLKCVPALRIHHLTPDQVRAYVIADNRLAELAGWEKSILASELQYLTSIDLDFDVSVTGFSAADIDGLLQEGTTPQEKPEAVELVGGPNVTRPGDCWQLGRHRLLCADATQAESYRAVLGHRRPSIVAADFPYNVKIDGHVSGLGATRHREFEMASGEMTSEQFTEFLRTIQQHLVRHTTAGSLHYIFMDWRHGYELLEAGRDTYHELKNICVWEKDNAGMGSLYRSAHELIFVFKNGDAPHRNNVELGKNGRHRTNVWHYPGVNAFARKTEEGRLGKLHPTVKPAQLVVDVLLDASARGDAVLDPFMGSGTTLIAAERTGREAYGLEIDPLYVDVAIRRWRTHTGEDAVHLASGRMFTEMEASVVAGGRHE